MASRRIVGYDRDMVMTPEECALALQISVKTLARSDLPCCYLTNRVRRYVWGVVVDALASRVDLVTP
ncbi:MAG: hypothetical protein ACT4P6_23005, partial [Gemmatimonadaceae bacterium]